MASLEREIKGDQGPLVRRIKLSDEQAAAATHGDGTRVIVATAGSGKTTTISAAIAMLILDHGVRESDILATSFTKASAEDLRSRIQAMAGRETGIITGTLHSYCFSLILNHYKLLGYSTMPTVIDESDVGRLLDQVILKVTGIEDKRNLPFSVSEVRRWISEMAVREYSSEARDRDHYFATKPPRPAVVTIGQEFTERLRKYGCVDFDTILVEALRLLRSHGEALAPALPKHVFIDEAQDLSAIQWLIIHELARHARSLTALGDDDQSLYSWRGALPWRFRDFADRAMRKFFLSSNRRCARNIVRLAAEVISEIPKERRIEKNLSATRSDTPGKVRYSIFPTPSLRLVANKIKEEVGRGERGKPSYDDYAIIVRSTTHTFAAAESALNALGIPYRILGGKSAFDQPEAKLLRSTAALVVGAMSDGDNVPADYREQPVHWAAVFSAFGIGPATSDGILERSSKMGGTIETLRTAVATSRIKDSNKVSIFGLISTITRLRQGGGKVLFGDLSSDRVLSGAVEDVIAREVRQRVEALRKKDGGIDAARVETMVSDGVRERSEAFAEAISAFAGIPLVKAIQVIELTQSKNKDEKDGGAKVTLSTAHSSKGLEWRTVFVLEVNCDNWPAAMATRGLNKMPPAARQDILDEERRLLYVAITRAKDEVYLLTPASNKSTGGANNPSSFLPLWVHERTKDVFPEVLSNNAVVGVELFR